MNFYDTQGAADYLGVHNRTIIGWIRKGKLKASRLPGGAFRMTENELKAILVPVGGGGE